MRKVLTKIFLLSVLACAGVSTASATANRPYDGTQSFYQTERDLFIKARNLLESGDITGFKQIQNQLVDYPLSRYLAYEYLRFQFQQAPSLNGLTLVDEFQTQYADDHLAARLTGKLLAELAGQEQWPEYLQIARKTSRSAGRCSSLLAKVRAGSQRQFDKAARQLWIKPQERNEACSDAFTVLEAKEPATVNMVWERINGLMDKRQVEEMKTMLPYLSSRDRQAIQSWIDGWSDPAAALLKKDAFAVDSSLTRRIVLSLVEKWAKRDPAASYDYWQKARNYYLFSSQHKYRIDALIARMAAYDGLPQADEWLHAIPDDRIDRKIRYWRIRTSLRSQDWQAVLDDIVALPDNERMESQWRYWYARASEQLGQTEKAQKLYRALADDMSYHGFLAADRIDVPYALKETDGVAEQERLTRLANNPVMIRAREYAWADLPWEGRREWMREVSTMSEQDRFAAAELAARWNWADRAVFTVAKTDKKDALTLRFPMPHKQEVEKASSRHAIDTAWIYGVMRRESGFITDVRSGAGAVGLMQLMPATARDVARRQGRKNPGDLTRAENNIGLGSFYLRYVLDKFDDNQILATAAYNAGPTRVKRWLPVDSALPADIWIDTIPYTETRRYVRAVTAYTAIFEWRRQKTVTPLHLRMQEIHPEPVLLSQS